METSYKGIFSHTLADGTITDVQVIDPNGYSMPLPINQYRFRGVLPVAESLPDQNSYKGAEKEAPTMVDGPKGKTLPGGNGGNN